MISISEAHEIIRGHLEPIMHGQAPLGESLGLRLATNVMSQADSPPFDKSMVDGYAISLSDDSAALQELELVTAGSTPTQRVCRGSTIRVMTGAPIPDGADAVVKWEDCELLEGGAIRNPAASVRPGACILRRGSSFRTGEVLLRSPKKLGPLDIALLAELGQAHVWVHPRPRVGVLATGDELVEAGEPVGPGQIRNSNGPMLHALTSAAGATPIGLGVGRDDRADLKQKIALGLECHVLLVSGGVSAGVKDLVPGVFTELHVEEKFHQVRIKPGKPLWFGVREHGDRRTLVFGLPGNPVSTLVAFRLFVAPALQSLAGDDYQPPITQRATLTKPISHRGKRPTFHPCRRTNSSGELTVEPLDWKGSADLATLTRTDCLAALHEGDYELAAGDEVSVLDL